VRQHDRPECDAKRGAISCSFGDVLPARFVVVGEADYFFDASVVQLLRVLWTPAVGTSDRGRRDKAEAFQRHHHRLALTEVDDRLSLNLRQPEDDASNVVKRPPAVGQTRSEGLLSLP